MPTSISLTRTSGAAQLPTSLPQLPAELPPVPVAPPPPTAAAPPGAAPPAAAPPAEPPPFDPPPIAPSPPVAGLAPPDPNRPPLAAAPPLALGEAGPVWQAKVAAAPRPRRAQDTARKAERAWRDWIKEASSPLGRTSVARSGSELRPQARRGAFPLPKGEWVPPGLLGGASLGGRNEARCDAAAATSARMARARVSNSWPAGRRRMP